MTPGTMPATLPGGSWPSPLGAADAGAAALSLGFVTSRAGRLFWIEGRPAERGRSVLVAEGPDGAIRQIVPTSANVRTRVHEYGGLPYAVVGDAVVYSEYADQRLRLLRDVSAGAFEDNATPEPRTPPGYRYADGCAHGDRVFCVREDHSGAGEARNTLVELRLAETSAGRVLFDASDFVAYPRVSADGKQIAFITWNHPDMPFDATRLHVAELSGNGLDNQRIVAGADDTESVLEPQWDGDALYFLSDRGGYWNLYRLRSGAVFQITNFRADLGGPLWQLGTSTYALSGDGRALLRVCRDAVDELVVVDLASGACRRLDLPFCCFQAVGLCDPHTGFAVAASASEPSCLIRFDLQTAAWRAVRRAAERGLAPEFMSQPLALQFPTRPAPDGTPRTAHAFFHPPCHPDFRSVQPPPLLVLLHGGPTAHAAPVYRPEIQFWTTRGFAVAVVNYGGSSGYGRAYRERLRGQWGVIDVQDTVAAVDYLVAQGRVDADRIAVRGGSAGGFTVLLALALTGRFNAGINYYGVADAESLAADTHKFESRYTDRLIAPLPQGLDIYRERSAMRHLDTLRTPLITFQGAEDRVVPPSQSRRLVEALRSRGVPVAYIEFDGEQHGFRGAGNIARALEAELYFLGRIFGFTPAGTIEPVLIDNLACPASQDSPAVPRSLQT
jgi:dipeptidyl aminopeptidase/acylaminoacyl peptidase